VSFHRRPCKKLQFSLCQNFKVYICLYKKVNTFPSLFQSSRQCSSSPFSYLHIENIIKENCEKGPNSTEITQENFMQVLVLKGQKCEIVVTPGLVVYVFSVFSVQLCLIIVLTETVAGDGLF
jgi:hypothetical protein